MRSGIGQHENDKRWMRAALAEARKAEGRTGTNPPVGCVLISPDNKLIAAGHTKPNGRPHAEAVALAEAGSAGLAHRVVGGTAYVTLEPCAHHGKTPPCAEALRDAGIARLVYALNDPDERVNGKGITCLRAASVEIASEFMTESALDITSGFICNKLKTDLFLHQRLRQVRMALLLRLQASNIG
ncbi:MAG: bifunctional diaminohydroxyphosphoribosylaminopyrimidine deaminase/5-amino-6-(5-phosphoribosylamino)uracil reductase RibD [Alphaproteobacteria bacterium]|nr:bifunctional diaminohydroxyphosphoribosylaminopyrimidine deaminase/5-amino-6-(5-phosphoribosylamino)uracil reductase RibD [Alphaproteobacteria bacterium]